MFKNFFVFFEKVDADAQQARNEAQYLGGTGTPDARAEDEAASAPRLEAVDAANIRARKTAQENGPRGERRVRGKYGKLKLSAAVAGVAAAVLLPVMLTSQGAPSVMKVISSADEKEKMSVGTIKEEEEHAPVLGPQQAPLIFPGELEESTAYADPAAGGEAAEDELREILVSQVVVTDDAPSGTDESDTRQAGGDGDAAARAAAEQYANEANGQNENQAQWVDGPVGDAGGPALTETNESLLREDGASGLLNTDDGAAGMSAFSAMPEDVGPLMMQMKERLMELGYMQKDVITEDYDPYTQLGVMFFQRDNGLDVTGIADAQTAELVLSGTAGPYCIVQGTEGEDVRQLQSGLNSLGYAVNASGVYDEGTAAAVREYQAARGAQATGVVDALLRKVIMDEVALRGLFAGYTANTNQGAEDLIAAAEQQLGKTYVLGGKGPDVFDCSGLVYYCLNQSGYPIEYMTSGGWAGSSFETVRGMDNLQRGDIVCFTGHVGIYLGDGQMLDASSSEGKVRITNDIRQTAYWINSFICGKRVLY